MRLAYYIALILIVFTSTTTAWAKDARTNPHHLSANSCASARCHDDVFAQWKGSSHAASSPLTNLLVRDFYQELGANPTQEEQKIHGQYPMCLNCHAPNAVKDGKTKLDQFNYAEGVNCVTCHTLQNFKGLTGSDGKPLVGIHAYEVSSTHLQSPSGRYLDEGRDADHALPMAPNQKNLRTSRVCLGCHGKMETAPNTPVCSTGVEYQSIGEPVTCQSCHMPKTNDSTDHGMRGGKSETMVSRALVMTLQTQPAPEGKLQIVAQVENMLPHGFPTGSPFRNAYLRVSVYDQTDTPIWSNFSTYPVQEREDPAAVFRLELNHPTSPFRATQVVRDNRLKPRETREIRFLAPAQNAKMVRAEVIYRMLTPELAEKYADKLGGEVLSPVVAAIAELRL